MTLGKLPPCVRNNNPGNIRKGRDTWLGEAPRQDGSPFVQFETPEMGCRAMAKVLLAYQRRYGLRTVRGIVSRWAPPSENPTESYVAHVAQSIGRGADEPIDIINDNGLLARLMQAMAKFEGDHDSYFTEAHFARGVYLAHNKGE
ncbi:MAG TPA: structural protein [Rhodospirillaceae bacterium]|nr:MAG: hypothetical protein A2018_05530 [Alphaproteobacteria bacterium GWF2_58_20]HAU28975.1 structural protein [Rhodospirillaceae bacterium]